jgi:protein phosphatase 2C family protein 2/3
MVLIQWLERGLGQILAPDENYEAHPDDTDTKSSFWQLVAPDPRFGAKPTTNTTTASGAAAAAAATSQKATPSEPSKPASLIVESPGAVPATPHPVVVPTAPSEAPPRVVECVHCHRLTPVFGAMSVGSAVRTEASSQKKRTPVGAFMTPSPGMKLGSNREAPQNEQVNSHVLKAAKGTADASVTPSLSRKKVDNVIRWCCSATTIQEAVQKKLRKILVSDPEGVQWRSWGLGSLCPDSYTPLMAAAHAGHVVAAEIVWEASGHNVELLLDTNLQGKTALHIAAEKGHMDMLLWLREKHAEAFGESAPNDLTGRTPLGVAMTSPEPGARKNRSKLMAELFSPVDPSVLGSPKPAQFRASISDPLRLVCGVADMPGKRILMEDAMVAFTFEEEDRAVGLFGVCDGHGDAGKVSQFVAEEVSKAFPAALKNIAIDSVDWTELCKDVFLSTDAKLRKKNIPGGSTAVFAVVTNQEIVVPNIGDSRCILVQTKDPGHEPELVDEAVPKSLWDKYSVIALSQDHKPNLEGEVARIENAGLTVTEERFEEKGEEVVIHKVALSESNRMACSRSFGDFEYKANSTLDADEQAVVAVPEVVVCKRDHDRDAFLVLACDGIWDVMDSEQVGKFVVDHVHGGSDDEAILPSSIGDRLLKHCLQLGSGDNMSVIIIALSKMSEKLVPTTLGAKTLDFADPNSASKEESAL